MTATNGIQGLLIETHNWGKTVAFWQALGYELEFETDHNSGQLRHSSGGPYPFIAERPEGTPLTLQPVLATGDAATFTPPNSGTVVRPFVTQVGGLQIGRNNALATLDPLNSWPPDTVQGGIYIASNPALALCEIETFMARQTHPDVECFEDACSAGSACD